MDNNPIWESIAEKLDMLISIQALTAVAHLQSKKEKILFLSEAGLSPKSIAPIVGSSAASVSQTVYAEKQKRKG